MADTNPDQLALTDDKVTLRHYIDVKIDYERKILDQRIDFMNVALRLQAIEYERRLEGLNHEQARLASDRERFVAREVYETAESSLSVWRDGVNRAILLAAGRTSGMGAIASGAALLIGVVVGIGGLVIALVGTR